MENTSPNSFVCGDWTGLTLTISPDAMSASLTGTATPGADTQAIRTTLSRLIRLSGLQHGVQPQAVQQALERLNQGQDLDDFVIARGSLPTPGRDATIELLVAPKQEAENGMAQGLDFREQRDLPLIEAGAHVARLIPEQPAIPGKTVLGSPVTGPAPRILKLQPARGVELQENGTLLVATTSGLLAQPEDDKFEIIDQLEIAGDVDFSVGHVDFPGFVKVAGTVLSGFKVNAYALEADSLESSSQVEVTGDLRIKKGILDAQVKAGGNVSAFYISQATVEAGGDVLVNTEIVQANVRAKGRIILLSESGRIVNSKVTGVAGVQTAKLVNSGQEDSQIRIGMDKEFEQQLAELRHQLAKLAENKKGVLSQLADQEPELYSMEMELKELITKLSENADEKTKENLLAQINMIMPLRAEAKTQVRELKQQFKNLEYEISRREHRLKEMLALAPSGTVRLTVKDHADAGTIILTPRARLVLDGPQSKFSAIEVEIKDKITGQTSFEVKLGKMHLLK